MVNLQDCASGAQQSDSVIWASLVAQLVKNPPAIWETRVQSVGWEDPLKKILWRLSTPVFWPQEFLGQRSLEGNSPWGHKESDETEQSTHTQHALFLAGRCFAFQLNDDKFFFWLSEKFRNSHPYLPQKIFFFFFKEYVFSSCFSGVFSNIIYSWHDFFGWWSCS